MAEKNLPKDLTENRKEIDQIDQKLLNLIHERSKLVINAGKIKKKSGDKTFYRPDSCLLYTSPSPRDSR